MLEAGFVVLSGGGRATVHMTRTSACAECGQCHGLGHSTRDLVLEVADPLGVKPGDLVRVRVPDIGVVRASLWGYGVPFLGLVIGGALGVALAPLAPGAASQEAFAGLGGLAGLAAGYYASSRYDRRLRRGWRGPEIVAVLEPGHPAFPASGSGDGGEGDGDGGDGQGAGA